MKILIDFDGVIHDYKHPLPARRMGAPIALAEDSLRTLMCRGHEVIIFTSRAHDERATKVVEDWLNFYQIPFHRITNIKENCDWYIDDKGIHFDNWESVLPQVINKTTE